MVPLDGSSICQGSGFTGDGIMPECAMNNAWVDFVPGAKEPGSFINCQDNVAISNNIKSVKELYIY